LIFNSVGYGIIRSSENVLCFELLCRIFETDKEGQKEASRFKALVFQIFTLASSVKLGDFLPWLKWTTHVTGEAGGGNVEADRQGGRGPEEKP
jgi:hypothetical protein